MLVTLALLNRWKLELQEKEQALKLYEQQQEKNVNSNGQVTLGIKPEEAVGARKYSFPTNCTKQSDNISEIPTE